MSIEYTPPVDQLLTLGKPRDGKLWLNYGSLRITHEHVPGLIRMVSDEQLHHAGSDSSSIWAPLHAWRALGELRAVEAVEPLIGLLHRIDEDGDDWIGEEMPVVFGLIGEPALEPLQRFLADDQQHEFARVAAVIGIRRIGISSAALRPRAIKLLVEALERHAMQPASLNGFLICELVELRAVDEIAVMERAFAAGDVDRSVRGDLADVRADLGLARPRTKPRAPGFAIQVATESVFPARPEKPDPDWMKEFLA